MPLRQPLTSLYRTYLRQVGRLPHHYLRQFFRIKASDDFRAIARTKQHQEALRKQKLRRVTKDLRKLELAISGRHKAFAYILDLAYGRKGKLKTEILKPLLTTPNVPLPQPIIRSVPKSRPPVYSPELTALLTNSASRITQALDARQLKFPPTLSPRANPSSEEARLLGRLSKRLEVNTRWRYFTREWKKVLPPLEVAVRQKDGSLLTNEEIVSLSGARPFGFQDQGLLEEIEDLVGSPSVPPPLTRREKLHDVQPSSDTTSKRHPSRWLRRRYQNLLGKLPVLVYQPHETQPMYNVNLPLNAVSNTLQKVVYRRKELDPVNLAWLARAGALDKQSSTKKSRN